LASWVFDPDLEKYRRTDPRVIVGTAINTNAGGVPDEIRADYLACYDGARLVESMRYVRAHPEELPVLAEHLPRARRPRRSFTRRNDRVVPVANAEFLHQGLPNNHVETIDAGHFSWEELPSQYASIVIETITGERPS
jgi:pimeloyl-ACP methyl ester carboxylesterase